MNTRDLNSMINSLKLWECCANNTNMTRFRRVPGGLMITEKIIFAVDTNIKGAEFPTEASCSSVFVPYINFDM